MIGFGGVGRLRDQNICVLLTASGHIESPRQPRGNREQGWSAIAVLTQSYKIVFMVVVWIVGEFKSQV